MVPYQCSYMIYTEAFERVAHERRSFAALTFGCTAFYGSVS
jgi:hypothetical protein